MILKELDPFSGEDKFQVAGRKAEEQMAHYLRRFFGQSTDVDVLNYLRIDLGGEVAQMDHLVLHPFGLLIVESKSVAGSVQIKDDGQWMRWFNKQPQGIRSPVTQAQMQVMLLKELLEKTVNKKGFFDQVQMDVTIAISDSGTIQWPASGPMAHVCKADQVPERINQRMTELSNLKRTVLTSEHRRVIGNFLCRVHKPLLRASAKESKLVAPTASPVPALMTASAQERSEGKTDVLPAKACKQCASTEVEARSGQYGYYFFCMKCEKNTGIKFSCPACGGEGRIRKQGKDFFAECKECPASVLFHTNA